MASHIYEILDQTTGLNFQFECPEGEVPNAKKLSEVLASGTPIRPPSPKHSPARQPRYPPPLDENVEFQLIEDAQDTEFQAEPHNFEKVVFIGAPFAEGQNIFGTEVAPNAMRQAGIGPLVEQLGWSFEDPGDIQCPGFDRARIEKASESCARWVANGEQVPYHIFAQEGAIRTEESVHDLKGAQGDPYACVENAQKIGRCLHLVHDAVKKAAINDKFALTIGGDHSLASATISAMLEAQPRLSVIWIDAHGDANTPDTSPSLHYHGMPAAHALGWFKKPLPDFLWIKTKLPESRLAYIGLRDLDDDEGQMLQDSSVSVFTMRDVDRLGIREVMRAALRAVDPYRTRPLHCSFDIDAMDPLCAPGTGTLARGGLTYRESHYICEELAATRRLVSMDLVEVNPLVDTISPAQPGATGLEGAASTETVKLAIGLILSALGNNIIRQTTLDKPTFESFCASPPQSPQQSPKLSPKLKPESGSLC